VAGPFRVSSVISCVLIAEVFGLNLS
jgi:hypothetical protein